MASAKREPITGVWGQSPEQGSGQSPWSEGQGAKPPPEAEGFLAFDRLQEGQNIPLLGIVQTVHNSKNVVKWKGIVA